MKKIISLLVVAALAFGSVPGTVHLLYNNGTVTVSGSDTFYEFDIQAYITGTESEDDLYLGDGDIYIHYPQCVFGTMIAGSGNLVIEKTGVFNTPFYEITQSNNTSSNVFALSFASVLTSTTYYEKVSTNINNPSDLLHVTIKAVAAGNGEVYFPSDVPITNNYWTLGDAPYNPGLDITAAIEDVYVEGPVNGEPYTSIELEYFNAEYKGGKVRLKWKTESETENLGFIVKRALVVGDEPGIYEEIDSYTTNDDLLGEGTTTQKSNYIYWDKSVKPGVTYSYVLQDVDHGGHIRECLPITIYIPDSKVISTDRFVFSSSYPNPFNPVFIVPFELFKSTYVDIKLYDVSGRMVKNIADKEFNPGTYNLPVSADGLSSGIYLLKTQVEGIVNTQKMLLVK